MGGHAKVRVVGPLRGGCREAERLLLFQQEAVVLPFKPLGPATPPDLSSLHEWHRARDGCITRETFRKNTIATRESIEFLLRAGTGLSVIGGSCAHILDHREALWRFVSQEGVEPTNNHAEQELRAFVLWRKTTRGSHSERGERFAANLKSVIHTCRKQKRHVLSYLTTAIQAALNSRSAPSLLPAPRTRTVD